MEMNTCDTNNNYPMFTNFINQTNLVIINSLPVTKGLFTRFKDSSGQPGSQSVLDYGLRDSESVHTVNSFVIDPDARFDFCSDHALLEATLSFGRKISVHWQVSEALQFKFTSKSNFSNFQSKLSSLISSVSINDFDCLSTEDMLAILVKYLQDSGTSAFGLKVKKIRRRQQIPQYVIGIIQTKNQLCRRIQEAYITNAPNLNELKQLLENIKLEIRNEISKIKLKRRTHIRMKILKNDPSRKRFWSFLKNQLRAASNITGK